MKYILSLLLLTLFFRPYAQTVALTTGQKEKPILDAQALHNWESIDQAPSIAPHFDFMCYYTQQGYSRESILHVYDFKSRNEWICPGGQSYGYTKDGQCLVLSKGHDSLCLFRLKDRSFKFISIASSIEFIQAGNEEWLLYKSPAKNAFTLQKLRADTAATGPETFPAIAIHITSFDDNSMVWINKLDSVHTVIEWVNLHSGERQTVWRGRAITKWVMDKGGNQLAFVAEDTGETRRLNIYDHRNSGTTRLTIGIDLPEKPGYVLSELDDFSKDGKMLFLKFKEEKLPVPNPELVGVDVWTYNDTVLQTRQLKQIKTALTYEACLHIADHQLTPLQRDGQIGEVTRFDKFDDYVLLDDTRGNSEEIGWSSGSQPTIYLVSTATGDQRPVNLINTSRSPDGRYIIGTNGLYEYDLIAYDMVTGKTLNISEKMPVPTFLHEARLHFTKAIALCGWFEKEGELLVSDQWDIWKVNIKDTFSAVNLTNGLGRLENIRFGIANVNFESTGDKKFQTGQMLLLTAFDYENKNEGFYRCVLGELKDPVCLSMDSYAYQGLYSNKTGPFSKEDFFVVERCNAMHSENYFWTRDFKTYLPISHISPEDNYQWLTDRLVSFKAMDGKDDRGILYLPENFDPGKKYPVIFTYYEKRSDELNHYRSILSEIGDDISIPWLVGHGYIVFVPDIHITGHNTGLCLMNDIMGARRFICEFPWVDSNRLGLQGQSYGGWETNYIATHTTAFAAATSSSGLGNLTSEMGDLWGGSSSGDAPKHTYYEDGQGRLGATLWEHPELYIENSPIFYLHHLKTPLLLVANKQDGKVSYEQGQGLFLALRRLGKPAWMLQYDGAGHGTGGADYIDLNRRMLQFFDYFLKGAAAASWMAHGIKARDKGIDDGMNLLPEREKPQSNLLLPGERRRVDTMDRRGGVTIVLP